MSAANGIIMLAASASYIATCAIGIEVFNKNPSFKQEHSENFKFLIAGLCISIVLLLLSFVVLYATSKYQDYLQYTGASTSQFSPSMVGFIMMVGGIFYISSCAIAIQAYNSNDNFKEDHKSNFIFLNVCLSLAILSTLYGMYTIYQSRFNLVSGYQNMGMQQAMRNMMGGGMPQHEIEMMPQREMMQEMPQREMMHEMMPQREMMQEMPQREMIQEMPHREMIQDYGARRGGWGMKMKKNKK